MTRKTAFLGTVAGTILAGTVGAQAAILDFTDLSAYTAYNGAGASGSIGTVGWTLTPNGGNLIVNTGDDCSVAALVCDTDGVGIGDDEVTNKGESLKLSFSQQIFLTGVHLLDLFKTAKGTESTIVNDGNGNLIVEIFGTDVTPGASDGYAFQGTGFTKVNSITFIPGAGKDDNNGDFALGAIEYASRDGQEPSPVPLPAGGLLLLGALGGLGLAKRRKA